MTGYVGSAIFALSLRGFPISAISSDLVFVGVDVSLVVALPVVPSLSESSNKLATVSDSLPLFFFFAGGCFCSSSVPSVSAGCSVCVRCVDERCEDILKSKLDVNGTRKKNGCK